MIDWKGTNVKVTPVGDVPGMSVWQTNTRMLVRGEVQRRIGMAASNLPKAGGNVLGMATAWTPNGPIIIRQDGDTIIGDTDPLALWGNVQLRKPIGNNPPTAPVINAIIFTPGSGTTVYTAFGSVNFDVQVTYDGLSGPLAYSYSFLFTPGPVNPPGGVQSNPVNFDISGAPSDGNYVGTVTVYPIANPLLFDTSPFSYATLP